MAGISAAAAMRLAWTRALDMAFPPTCLACETATAEPHGLCAACWREAPFLSGRVCACCGAPAMAEAPGEREPWTERRCRQCAETPRNWRFGRAAARYHGVARRMILQLKHADRTAAALPMAAWMARAGADLFSPQAALDDGPAWLVPTPLHWRRRAVRRFNQAAELARRLSDRLEIPAAALLSRSRPTESQDGRTREQRAVNVAGAFRVSDAARGRVAGARVILIDDVLTTGATLAEATRVLQDAGAAAVDVLVFARVTRPAFDENVVEPI